jgi:hypothetical protein
VAAIRVHAQSEADARCVGDALEILPVDVRVHARAWVVDVSPRGDSDRAIVDVLDVLADCLDENGVPTVWVDVAGRTYTLHGAPHPAGLAV